MMTYLAHPIDGRDGKTLKWLHNKSARIIKMLQSDEASRYYKQLDNLHWGVNRQDQPLAVFSPEFAWQRGFNRDVSIINRLVIRRCDFLVAVLLPSFTFGTIREIEFAIANGIPVIVFTENPGELKQHVESADMLVIHVDECDHSAMSIGLFLRKWYAEHRSVEQ